MRVIAHISDLHFGVEDERIAGRLLEDLNGIGPSLVVISGDLTQRAWKSEFEAARAFIRKITAPCLAVPGNHDIPFLDVIQRTLRPLHRYRHYITADLNPVFEDDELIVLGANTARSATLKNGRISAAQIKMLADRLCSAGSHLFKVLVTHHPFLPPLDDPYAASVGRGGLAAGALEPCGLDLLLAGHYHRGYMGDLQSRDITVKRSIIVAQAGTAISKRTRGEGNSYDRIVIDPPEICFDRYAWDGRGFVKAKSTPFKKVSGAWQLQPQDICGTRARPAPA